MITPSSMVAGPDGQWLLMALAAYRPDQAVPPTDLFRAAGLDPEAGDAAVRVLLDHDLVLEDERGLRLAVPLMRRWLRLRQSQVRGAF